MRIVLTMMVAAGLLGALTDSSTAQDSTAVRTTMAGVYSIS
jgi:hypothetical protein